MRIVNHREFLRLPSGTVFAKCHPCVIEDMHIKGNNVSEKDFNSLGFKDFDSEEEYPDDFFAMIDNQLSVPLDLDAWQRDGLACYEENQLYMIYEKADVLALITRLQECVK